MSPTVPGRPLGPGRPINPLSPFMPFMISPGGPGGPGIPEFTESIRVANKGFCRVLSWILLNEIQTLHLFTASNTLSFAAGRLDYGEGGVRACWGSVQDSRKELYLPEDSL